MALFTHKNKRRYVRLFRLWWKVRTTRVIVVSRRRLNVWQMSTLNRFSIDYMGRTNTTSRFPLKKKENKKKEGYVWKGYLPNCMEEVSVLTWATSSKDPASWPTEWIRRLFWEGRFANANVNWNEPGNRRPTSFVSGNFSRPAEKGKFLQITSLNVSWDL